ncbi:MULTISPECIES: ABC-2 transporter permease [Clostridium]|uniref:ABC-2 transporter permease n=1 Tax=Clostridium TaxID=1485 RepID=UPI0002892936|nr:MULTISPECIES: ABC-2 transporter permease [Clostridium]MDF2503369.1 family transporter protein [Clostridium sp.]
MGNLILKDVLIQKKYFIFFIAFSIIVSLFYSRMGSLYMNFVFIMIPTMVAMGFITNCSIKDEKAENMINSLPVKRIDVIMAKYMAMLLFIVIGSGIIFISSSALNFIGIIHLERLMNFRDIGICFGIVIFLSSIFLPVNFKLGYSKSRYLVMILYIGIFFVISFTGNSKYKRVELINRLIYYLNNAQTWQIVLLIACLLGIIMLVSFSISCYLYKNKDLN